MQSFSLIKRKEGDPFSKLWSNCTPKAGQYLLWTRQPLPHFCRSMITHQESSTPPPTPRKIYAKQKCYQYHWQSQESYIVIFCGYKKPQVWWWAGEHFSMSFYGEWWTLNASLILINHVKNLKTWRNPVKIKLLTQWVIDLWSRRKLFQQLARLVLVQTASFPSLWSMSHHKSPAVFHILWSTLGQSFLVSTHICLQVFQWRYRNAVLPTNKFQFDWKGRGKCLSKVKVTTEEIFGGEQFKNWIKWATVEN